MESFLLELGVLRRTAEARVVMGGGVPEEFAAMLRVQNASLPENGKSLVWASSQGAMAVAAAAERMRLLCGSCGYAARQDVLAVADVDVPPWDKNVHAA